jgi:general secretion pathway protein M
MKQLFSGASRTAILVAFFIAILIGGSVAYVIAKHRWARAALAEIEPRYARLLGLQGSANDLERASAERRAALGRQAYLASQDLAVASSDAQQRAREAFTKAGLQVASTQILPPKPVEGFDRIPLVLRLEGDLAALHAALVTLPAQTPALFVDGFNVQTTGMPLPDAPQRLNIQVNLFVLRVRT